MHMASWVHYAGTEDTAQNSTPMDSIWRYLKDHYNMAAKGSDFLNITQVTYTAGTLTLTYYKQYRGVVMNNLRRKGNSMGVKKNGILLKEE